jgi:2-amino-4-hydroxy-6-hydroxymethyldihydropteridine diphosphokinase
MPQVYLALGTNLGDRRANLRAAVEALAPAVRVMDASGIYETPAWGYEDQPPFLNMALKADTDLAPEALLAYLKKLESELGRTPSFHWGPRLIDIDILFYDGIMLDTPPLTIPHPRLHERAFVLVPLADIAPDLLHPKTGKTVQQMLEGFDRSGIRPFVEEM